MEEERTEAFLENAAATFEEVAENGTAAPLEFEGPNLGLAQRVDAPILDPETGNFREYKNIIYECHPGLRYPSRAYRIGRTLRRCSFGVVKFCNVLKFRNDPKIPWEFTEEFAAVKILSWRKIRNQNSSGRHPDDPEKEIATMQYLCQEGVHPNIIHPQDALSDEDYLLLFMPYLNSDELLVRVQEAGRFPEKIARYWFRQILKGLSHFQRRGVCHRDMSLENIMVADGSVSIIIDMGMSLKVPFTPDGSGVEDVSAGSMRKLISAQPPCGKFSYMSPEIFSRQDFDGFAIDLWAAGVILFMMLIGTCPYEIPAMENVLYRHITQGGLDQLLRSWGRPVSPEALDLLQNMLMDDPRQRLSLRQVEEHPWLLVMEEVAILENQSATFDEVAENGSAPPLNFEPPNVGLAERVDAPVYNPITHEIKEVANIVYERRPDGRHPARAYCIGRKLRKCIFGVVKSCTVLRYRNDLDVPWEITDQQAAVKIMSWDKIRNMRHMEDPQKEIATMQYLCQSGIHPQVMHPLDALYDNDYLLLFMPYLNSGDLFGFVQQAGRFPERIARYWFHQILQGMAHFQRCGVSHRDMSLENIMVYDMSKSVIIDMGMCLRVPYNAPFGNGVTDVTAGTMRKLISSQVPCGKQHYMSPEIFKSDDFDGFGIDLWGAGVILFIMLVGLPPYDLPTMEDPRYRQISRGGLEQLLRSWDRQVSPEAMDLMQNMLLDDPRRRLSFYEIREHPWVLDEVPTVEMARPAAPTEGWRY